jgi:hypothetical protein
VLRLVKCQKLLSVPIIGTDFALQRYPISYLRAEALQKFSALMDAENGKLPPTHVKIARPSASD